MSKVYLGIVDEQIVGCFTYEEAAINWLKETPQNFCRKLIEFNGIEIALACDGEVVRFDEW